MGAGALCSTQFPQAWLLALLTSSWAPKSNLGKANLCHMLPITRSVAFPGLPVKGCHFLSLSCFCSVQFHLSTTFLCARFIARGSRMSTSIDEFRDYPGSNPFVSNIPMCLLHCSWLSHLYLYWFSRSEIIQLYSICKPHSYVLASLLMALASQLLLISKKRDRSVLFHL